MLSQYLPILVFLIIAFALGIALRVVGSFFRVDQPDPDKNAPYECGFGAYEDALETEEVKPNHIDTTQLDIFHEQILLQTCYKNSNYADWYVQVYYALKKVETDEKYYQACQLLRDIYFEFSNYKSNQDSLEVLEKYKNLCPKPMEAIDQLLALKPAYQLDNYDETQLKNQSIFQILVELRDKSSELDRRGYTKEARLLSQARQNLYQAALFAEKNDSRGKLPDEGLLADPRYHQVKKHRGIVSIWEAVEELISKLLSCVL
jgi:hypothetical protein